MQFDHEKLEVYQLTLQFIVWVTPLIAELRERHGRLVAEPCEHLDRASLSILFNTAEGNGKRQRQTRAKFFDDARGSATECAACLDAIVAKSACPALRVQDGKDMLLRIVSMLTRLVAKFETPDALREEGPEYRVDEPPA
jgi:four helix bundle protein